MTTFVVTDEQIRQIHRQAPFVDVHAHLPLKLWLYDWHLDTCRPSTTFFNPYSFRTGLQKLKAGEVPVLWATHHVPEETLLEDSVLVRLAAWLGLDADKLRHGTPLERLEEQVTGLEEAVRRYGDSIEVVSTPEELESVVGEGGSALLHAVEGAHVLEGNPKNVDRLAELGVVSLTLAHFYPNGFVTHVDAIPDTFLLKNFGSFSFDCDRGDPLSDRGREVLDRMTERGMIPDLTHCSPAARRAIYEYLPSGVPVVATHVGLHEFKPDPMNLTRQEIREIADRGGGIGLILFNYWLDEKNPSTCRETLLKSVKAIHDVTGSWDNIMIGTDFDGMTDPPDDVRDLSEIGTVTRYLLEEGLPEGAVKKIIGGNALRILRDVSREGV